MCVSLSIVVSTELISNRLKPTRQRTYLTRGGGLDEKSHHRVLARVAICWTTNKNFDGDTSY